MKTFLPDTIDLGDLPASPGASGPTLGMHQLFKMLRRNIWLLMAIVTAVTVPAAYVVLSLPPYYTAAGSLMVAPSEPTAFDPQSLFTIKPESVSVNNEIQVLYSPELAGRVAARTGFTGTEAASEPDPLTRAIAAVRGAVRAAKRTIIEWMGLPQFETSGGRTDPATEALLDSLKVRPIERSRAVEVLFTSQDPELARRIVDTLMEMYLAQQVDNRIKAVQATSLWLSQRLEELQAQVRRQEEALEAFKARSAPDSSNLSLIQAQIAESNAQLARAQSEAAGFLAQRDRAEAAIRQFGPRGIFGVIRSPLADSLREQETRLRASEAEANSGYGTSHPRVRNIRSEISIVSNQVNREAADLYTQVETAAAMAAGRVRALESTLAGLHAKVQAIGATAAEQRALEREAEASRLVLKRFLERYEEMEQGSTNQSNAWVIHSAFVPSRPTGPKTKLLLMAAFAGSLVLGLVVVGWRELVRRGVAGHDDVEELLGRPCFGLVPRLPAHGFAARPPQDHVLDHHFSPYAEALKHILVSIDIAAADRPRGRTVLVTSALPAEGKSTLVASIGRLCAAMGGRALVIDCDLRRPAIARLLKVPRKAGLAEYLEGSATLEETISEDSKSGLVFISAGAATIQTSALLQSRRMQDLIELAARRFDIVLIDAPPVLAVPDARVLARHVQVCVVAARWLRTKRSVLKMAVDRLAQSGAASLGVVLSNVDLGKAAVYGSESMEYLSDVRGYGATSRLRAITIDGGAMDGRQAAP